MTTRRLAALCFELPSITGSDAAPSTITLIPAPGADGFVRGVDGRAWKLSNPAAVVAAFSRKRAITENHAGRLAASRGDPSPAFGWITAVRHEAGAIVGDVSWNPRGEAALNGRDYLYFSPEFIWENDNSEIVEYVGGSLTNDPNFTQLALNGEQDQEPPVSKLIAQALGLAETADEAACVVAINSLKSEKQTALNAAAQPDMSRFAPRAELDVALNRATTAETRIADLAKARAEAEAVDLVDEAQAAGKVIPATRDLYLAMCRAEGGIESFRKLVAVMPVIGEPSKTDKKPGAAETGAEGLTANQLAICRATGTDPKKYAESLKAVA